ncbi:SH3 domain-containing protein [Thioclava sp. BHET1]|nr:SH3 domain-containing protein [Thioclava sp. BHET1]
MLKANRTTALNGLIAAGLVLAASPAVAQGVAQREARVTFAPGASGTTIEGRIRGNEGVTYILGARAGQRMRITFTPSNASANFNLFAPGQATAIFMGAAGGHSFDGVLSDSGDYRIQVYLMRNAARRNESASYKIRFAIAGAASTATPAPDFADGQAGGPDFWQVAGVSAGDRLNLRAGPSAKEAVVARLANGTVLRNLGCRGSGTARWCRVATPDGAISGWVAGRFLVEGAAPCTSAGASGGPAPEGAGPDVYRRPSGEFEVGWRAGCTVLYDPSGRRISAGSSCSTRQLARSDAAIRARTAKPYGSATGGVDSSKAIAGCKAALSARTGAARGDIAVVEAIWGQAGIGVTMTAAGSDRRWSCLSDAAGHVQGLN